MLSVIIPTFNHAHYIDKLLPRLLSYGDLIYEIIICNDCSEDNTSEILDKFTSIEKIKIFNNINNIGAAASVCSVYKFIEGKYVVFLSSDDYFIENTMRSLLEQMVEENANLGFGHYSFETDCGIEEVNHIGWRNLSVIENNFVNLLVSDHYMFLGGAIIKKSAIDELFGDIKPFELSLNKAVDFDGLGEFRALDWNLALEISSMNNDKIIFTNQVTGVFRKVENQLSSDERYIYTGRSAFEMALLLIKFNTRHSARKIIISHSGVSELIKKLLLRKVSSIKLESVNETHFSEMYLPVIRGALALLEQ